MDGTSVKKFISKLLYIAISLSAGFFVFNFYFQLSILDPTNTAWLLRDGGDGLQHYLGSFAFRSDNWHFPITKTTILNSPEGVSIIYTDSNPLLSIIAKIFKDIFPPEYQFFGIWYLLCWMLQSLLGYLLILKITRNQLYALLSGLLFCLLPTHIFRIGHSNLLAFWLILLTLYIFISPFKSKNKKALLFFSTLFLSSLIHAYFTIMLSIIVSVWFINQCKVLWNENDKKGLKEFLLTNSLCVAVFIVLIWATGYFYNKPVSDKMLGYGYFSMNFNAIFNPLYDSFSNFLPPMLIGEGQYEGFQYLGLGILLFLTLTLLLPIKKYQNKKFNIYSLSSILLIALTIYFSHKQATIYEVITFIFLVSFFVFSYYLIYKSKERTLLLLFIPAILCLILALSHNMKLGHSKIIQVPLSDSHFYAAFFRNIRSSGRLFWVSIHILLLVYLFILFKYKGAKISIPIVITTIALQMYDLSNLRDRINSDNKLYESVLDKNIQKAILNADAVKFLNSSDLRVAEFAILNGKTVNNFYTAHGEGYLTRKKLEELPKFVKLDSQDLYFSKTADFPKDKPITLNGIFVTNDFFILNPEFFLKTDTNSTYIIKRKDIKRLSEITRLIANSKLFVIAVQDEASNKLPEKFVIKMNAQFNTHLDEVGYKYSYLAVFEAGKLVSEKISENEIVEYIGDIGGLSIKAMSAGANAGSNSSVEINGVEYSTMQRGFNIVYLDTLTGRKPIFNIANLDTFENEYPY